MNWDNKWPAVSALATVAALILPLFLFVFGRNTKELTIETVSNVALVVTCPGQNWSSVKDRLDRNQGGHGHAQDTVHARRDPRTSANG